MKQRTIHVSPLFRELTVKVLNLVREMGCVNACRAAGEGVWQALFLWLHVVGEGKK